MGHSILTQRTNVRGGPRAAAAPRLRPADPRLSPRGVCLRAVTCAVQRVAHDRHRLNVDREKIRACGLNASWVDVPKYRLLIRTERGRRRECWRRSARLGDWYAVELGPPAFGLRASTGPPGLPTESPSLAGRTDQYREIPRTNRLRSGHVLSLSSHRPPPPQHLRHLCSPSYTTMASILQRGTFKSVKI